MLYEADVRLCGIPVLAKFNIAGAEPDVGISEPYIDDYELYNYHSGRPLGPWLERKATEDEMDDFYRQLLDAAAEL